MQRKQRETDIRSVEEQIDGQYRAIQARINELEPAKLRAYNELMVKQREIQDRCMHCEAKLAEVNNRVRAMESDERSNNHRKEFSNLERRYQALKKDAESLDQELEIASMDPKEAHAQFVARVNKFKQSAKDLSDQVTAMRDENAQARRALDDMDSNTSEDDNGDTAKYELLVKRDQEMTGACSYAMLC